MPGSTPTHVAAMTAQAAGTLYDAGFDPAMPECDRLWGGTR